MLLANYIPQRGVTGVISVKNVVLILTTRLKQYTLISFSDPAVSDPS